MVHAYPTGRGPRLFRRLVLSRWQQCVLVPATSGRAGCRIPAPLVFVRTFWRGTYRRPRVNVHTNSSNTGPRIGGLRWLAWWNDENGTRSFRVPSRELFVHDDAVPFFPTSSDRPPCAAARAIDFPFPFLPTTKCYCFWRRAALQL